mmetsp:Transcript_16296/g.33110  ORF Transcript_16296/g.33110 Transcript_16296/m.33110 type:complete len:341 (+) Transcript_16296:316-1338(+)
MATATAILPAPMAIATASPDRALTRTPSRTRTLTLIPDASIRPTRAIRPKRSSSIPSPPRLHSTTAAIVAIAAAAERVAAARVSFTTGMTNWTSSSWKDWWPAAMAMAMATLPCRLSQGTFRSVRLPAIRNRRRASPSTDFTTAATISSGPTTSSPDFDPSPPSFSPTPPLCLEPRSPSSPKPSKPSDAASPPPPPSPPPSPASPPPSSPRATPSGTPKTAPNPPSPSSPSSSSAPSSSPSTTPASAPRRDTPSPPPTLPSIPIRSPASPPPSATPSSPASTDIGAFTTERRTNDPPSRTPLRRRRGTSFPTWERRTFRTRRGRSMPSTSITFWMRGKSW